MKNKLAAAIFLLCITLSLLGSAAAADAADDIIVLYTNDVHCGVDDKIGYAGLAAYKTELETVYGEENVTLVDAGDAVQGNAIGTLSEGEDIVNIMNKVGYDVVTLGNHEFDYGMKRLYELMEMQAAEVVSCNFKSIQTGDTVFAPYTIIDYGDIQIAYVGITTPKSFTSSTTRYFQDDQGNYIYSFCESSSGEALYSAVQEAVDAAIKQGADCVVAVSHCGVGAAYEPWQSADIIANTSGIDAFIDGHSHSTITSQTYKNEKGEDVTLTSTGTKLAAIGKLVFAPDGTITAELVTGYADKDKSVASYIKDIQTKNDEVLNTVVAKTNVALVVNDPITGQRLIRSRETNLGDLAADAYRSVLNADIAVVNGGGIRADIAAGDITYNDIISVHPFGNSACVVAATGQEILNLLEMGARSAPGESGGFQQVSGLTYEIHTDVKSSVVLDDKGSFVSVGGKYRVQNVMIGGQPLDLNKTYSVASHNYLIKNGGDGFGQFMDNPLLKDEVMIDNEVLIAYIVDKLHGVIGTEYADINGQGRIAVLAMPFTDVAADAWYADSVSYIYNEGIIYGTSDTIFAPESDMTRAMFITMLYRQAGSPKVDGRASDRFSDCPDNTWYSNAVIWAAKSGIATGAAAASFAPENAVTRQEMAVFLYRYIQGKGGGMVGSWMYRPDFTDLTDIADWANEAVAYCHMNGLITGMTSDKFAPASPVTRAAGAVTLQRFDSKESVKIEAAL